MKTQTYDMPTDIALTDNERAWADDLDDRKGFWIIRHLPGDRVWFNATALRLFGIKEPLVLWENFIRWIHHEDAVRLEDLHSFVFKHVGKTRENRLRVKLEPHRFTDLDFNSICVRNKRRADGYEVIVMRIWIPSRPDF